MIPFQERLELKGLMTHKKYSNGSSLKGMKMETTSEEILLHQGLKSRLVQDTLLKSKDLKSLLANLASLLPAQ